MDKGRYRCRNCPAEFGQDEALYTIDRDVRCPDCASSEVDTLSHECSHSEIEFRDSHIAAATLIIEVACRECGALGSLPIFSNEVSW